MFRLHQVCRELLAALNRVPGRMAGLEACEPTNHYHYRAGIPLSPLGMSPIDSLFRGSSPASHAAAMWYGWPMFKPTIKLSPLMLTLLATAALAVGCKRDESASQQWDKIQAKTAEAAHDMNDYTYAQKPEFVKAMRTELD